MSRTRKEIRDEITKLDNELKTLPTRWDGHKFPSIFFIWRKGENTHDNVFHIIENPHDLSYFDDCGQYTVRPAYKNEVLNLFDDFEGAKNTEQTLQPDSTQ